MNEMKGSKEGLLEKNIVQWSEHCRKLEAKVHKTTEDQDDLDYRRLQIKRWEAKA